KDTHSFAYADLLECGHCRLFGAGNAQRPLPPMLMFDRITRIAEAEGAHGKGLVTAELDIRPELWLFPCQFENDPVIPGCPRVGALWQLVGFYLGWLGAPRKGRALGVGGLKFNGQVTPEASRVTYTIDIKRVLRRGFAIGI